MKSIWAWLPLLRMMAAHATLKRFSNALQTWRSYRQAMKGKHYDLAPYPVALSLEPTTACNLRCPFCISGKRAFTRPTGFLDFALFKKVIDEISPYTLWLNLYFQGEPFLHSEATAMIHYATQKKMLVSTSSNAHYFDATLAKNVVKSGLQRLIISIDGAQQETYAAYRVGGSLEKVIQGTKQIVSAKKKIQAAYPWVIWQCVVFKHNEHDMEALKKMARAIGVNEVVFKTAQIDSVQDMAWLPEAKSKRRYAPDFTPLQVPERGCWRMWHSAVMTWDGTIVPCCFDKDAKHPLGNVAQHSLYHIWHDEAYTSFRTKLLQSRKDIDICTNCTEGAPTWIR